MPLIENEQLNSSSTIPVADGLPVLGNSFQYLNAPIRMFVDAYAKHGPIFKLQFPGQPVVVIAGKACGDFLKDNPVKGMHRKGLFDPFTYEVGLDVFGEQGIKNERLRSVLKFPYSRQIASQFVPEITEIVREKTRAWYEGEEIDLFKETAEIALLSAMAVTTPIQMYEERVPFSKAGNTVMYAIFNLRPRGVLKTPWYRSARERMRSLVDEAIERHKKGEFSENPKMYLLDAGLKATTPDGTPLDPRAIRAAALFGLAGTEIYIGRLIGFLVCELLHNREFLNKVLIEVDTAFSGGTLDANAFRRMPYLRAAWHETLRCYPLLPGYPYLTEKPMDLMGHSVPENTYVLFVPYADHFSGEYYTNPLVFDPMRCLAPRRELSRNGAFTPFGMGRKTCLAQGFSETIALTVVCSLLREIDFQLVKPSYKIALGMAPLITPDEKIPLRIQSKRGSHSRGLQAGLELEPDFESFTQEPIELPHMDPETLSKNSCIIAEGDPAQDFYIILEGEAGVYKGKKSTKNRVATLTSGQMFGEIGLLKNVPRTASVFAETTITFIRIGKDHFIHLISEYDLSAGDLSSLIHRRYVQSVLSKALPKVEKGSQIKDFHWKYFKKGEVIFKQGDPSNAFYIVARGSVRVSSISVGKETDSVILGEGKFFGEMGVLSSNPRCATVSAETEVTCLYADRETLLELVNQDGNAMKDIALVLLNRVNSNAKKSDKKTDS